MFFFISTAQWSIEQDDTITSKVKKGKRKTHGRNAKKPQNVQRGKTTNRQTAFKITVQGDF